MLNTSKITNLLLCFMSFNPHFTPLQVSNLPKNVIKFCNPPIPPIPQPTHPPIHDYNAEDSVNVHTFNNQYSDRQKG